MRKKLDIKYSNRQIVALFYFERSVYSFNNIVHTLLSIVIRMVRDLTHTLNKVIYSNTLSMDLRHLIKSHFRRITTW